MTADFVYIFGPEEHGIDDAPWIGDGDYGVSVKVGKTSDPKGCLSSLRRARPDYCFWAVKFFPGHGDALEKSLHEFWRAYHQKGEFFALPQADIFWFEKLDGTELRSNRFCLYVYLHESHDKWLKRWGHKLQPWHGMKPPTFKPEGTVWDWEKGPHSHNNVLSRNVNNATNTTP